MDLIVILLVGILGIAAGVAIGIVAGRRKSVEAQTRCKILEARLADKEADFTNRMAEKDESFRRILSEKEEAHRAYDAQIRKNSADALEEMQKRFDETVAKMQEQLKNSTADLLKQRQHEFEESSKADISRRRPWPTTLCATLNWAASSRPISSICVSRARLLGSAPNGFPTPSGAATMCRESGARPC